MKQYGKIRKVHIILVAAFLIYSFTLAGIVRAVTSEAPEPGTEENPLVAKDYVDSRVEEAMARAAEAVAKAAEALARVVEAAAKTDEIAVKTDEMAAMANETNTRIEQLQASVAELAKQMKAMGERVDEHADSMVFVPLQIKAGKKLIAGAGAEIVLRGGEAEAIASENGGLADVTAGEDIPTGGNIPPNHLLLVSRDDGRGLTAKSDIWVLIKGNYSIE